MRAWQKTFGPRLSCGLRGGRPIQKALTVAGALVLPLAATPVWAQSDDVMAAESDAEASRPAAPTTSGEVITVSEAEAEACAAKLEPMAASFKDPANSMYMQRLNDGVLQIWAPRDDGPNAPFRPWCMTTIAAVAGMNFLNSEQRTVVTQVLAASSPAPPPVRQGEEEPPLPPTVIVEKDEDPGERQLPAAFQMQPPKGARSAAQIGVPVPQVVLTALSLPDGLAAALTVCQNEGGQITAVYDRMTGAMQGTECRHPDGTATGVPALATLLGEDTTGPATVARDR